MKKGIIFIILITITLLFTTCGNRREREAMIDLEKMNFAFFTHAFDFQMVIDGEIRTSVTGFAFEKTRPTFPEFDPFYTELVFVHSQEEAQGFPDSTIVAWPREERAPKIIHGIHWAASRDENSLLQPGGFGGIRIRDPFSLEDFGLTYPLTVADLVDNWEKLNDLWRNGLTENERTHLPNSTWGPIEDE
jgi:hypothetical protein